MKDAIYPYAMSTLALQIVSYCKFVCYLELLLFVWFFICSFRHMNYLPKLCGMTFR